MMVVSDVEDGWKVRVIDTLPAAVAMGANNKTISSADNNTDTADSLIIPEIIKLDHIFFTFVCLSACRTHYPLIQLYYYFISESMIPK